MKFVRKRLLIISVVLAGVLTAGFIIRQWLRPSEPAYQGRPISGWLNMLAQYERSNRLKQETYRRGYMQNVRTAPVRGVALHALRTIGQPAVPYLSRALSKPDGGFQRHYWRFYLGASPRWVRFLPQPPIDSVCLRRAAISALAVMGDTGKTAWPAMLVAANDSDPEVRYRAVQALKLRSERDVEVSAAISERLLTPGLAPAKVLETVEQYGLRAPQAVQALARIVRDGPVSLRDGAITQLRALGNSADQATPYLVSALTETNREIRCRSCQALAAIKPAAAKAVPVLIAALDDPESVVRANAANALAVYGTDAAAAVPKLATLYTTQEGIEKYCTGRALVQIDPNAAAKLGAE